MQDCLVPGVEGYQAPGLPRPAGIGALVCVIAYVLMYVAAAALGISAAVYAY